MNYAAAVKEGNGGGDGDGVREEAMITSEGEDQQQQGQQPRQQQQPQRQEQLPQPQQQHDDGVQQAGEAVEDKKYTTDGKEGQADYDDDYGDDDHDGGGDKRGQRDNNGEGEEEQMMKASDDWKDAWEDDNLDEDKDRMEAAYVAQSLIEVDLLAPLEDEVKRDEMRRTCSFEKERRYFFVAQLHGQTAYFHALKGLIGQSAQVLNNAIVYLGFHLDDRTHAAKSAIALVDRARAARANRESTGKQTTDNMDNEEHDMKDAEADRQDDNGEGQGDRHKADEGILPAMEELHLKTAQMELKICEEIRKEVLEPAKDVFNKSQKDGEHILREGHKSLIRLTSFNNYVMDRYMEVEKSVAEAAQRNGADQWASTLRFHQAAEQQRNVWPTLGKQMAALYAQTRYLVLKRRQSLSNAVGLLTEKHNVTGGPTSELLEAVKKALDDLGLSEERFREDMEYRIGSCPASIMPYQHINSNNATTTTTTNNNNSSTDDKQATESSSSADQPSMKKRSADLVLGDVLQLPEAPSLTSYGYKDLTALLTSCPLALKSEIVEYNQESILKSRFIAVLDDAWEHALAVLTHDHYLHLFQLPKAFIVNDKKSTTTTTVNEALLAVIPGPLSTSDGPLTIEQQAAATVLPTISLDVRENDVYSRPNKTPNILEHQTEFMLTGLRKNKGLKGKFIEESKSTFKIRSETPEKMMKWMLSCMAIAKTKEGHGSCGIPKMSAIADAGETTPPTADADCNVNGGGSRGRTVDDKIDGGGGGGSVSGSQADEQHQYHLDDRWADFQHSAGESGELGEHNNADNSAADDDNDKVPSGGGEGSRSRSPEQVGGLEDQEEEQQQQGTRQQQGSKVASTSHYSTLPKVQPQKDVGYEDSSAQLLAEPAPPS